MCADVLESLGYRSDPQCHFNAAEVMTTAVTAALFYSSNHAFTRRFLHQHGYTRNTLSASRFCRRLARVPQNAWDVVFALLAQVFIESNTARGANYVVDLYPVLVCANCRINRCQLFPVQEHRALRGYQASKKRYFYGFKVHLLVTSAGEPVEFFLSEGSLHDIEGLRRLLLDLPQGANVWGDKAYHDHNEQWLLQDAASIRSVALKRRNARQGLPPCWVYLTQIGQQQVETAFSLRNRTLPKHLHAVSSQGFLLKLQTAVIAYAFDRLLAPT